MYYVDRELQELERENEMLRIAARKEELRRENERLRGEIGADAPTRPIIVRRSRYWPTREDFMTWC
jgi:hypothetical protein